MSALPILIVSGWGSDERTVWPQLEHFGDQAIYCAWVPWRAGDSLTSYAERLAAAHRPAGPCALVGVSMGGMLALEMRQFLDARAVVLVASAHGPHGLPRSRWLLRAAVSVVPLPLAWLIHRSASLISRLAARVGLADHHVLAEIDTWSSRDLLRASRAVLGWRGSGHEGDATGPAPRHIHGARDGILRCVHDEPNRVVQDGGHFISLTHPQSVNAFVSEVLREATVASDPEPIDKVEV